MLFIYIYFGHSNVQHRKVNSVLRARIFVSTRLSLSWRTPAWCQVSGELREMEAALRFVELSARGDKGRAG